MGKQLMAARLLEYFRRHGVNDLRSAAESLGESLNSTQNCAYKLRDKGMLASTGETVILNKLQSKTWRITEAGLTADPVSPLKTKKAAKTSKRLQRQQEIAERRRFAEEAQAARRAGNVCKTDADYSKATMTEIPNLADRWQAEQTMVRLFSSMKPGQYAFEPASASARGK